MKKLKFSGHQTFAFRYGWLEKGYRFVEAGQQFQAEDAIVSLGVGKNMVESIKYWGEMTGVLNGGQASEWGRALLADEGWDPYLEDDNSLWLLHWHLVTHPEYLTAGSILFADLHKPEFTKAELLEVVAKSLAHHEQSVPSATTLQRDVDCYLRVYAGTRYAEKRQAEDESFECPLLELGLIQPLEEANAYRFVIGPKPSLAPEVLGYALWDFFRRRQKPGAMRLQEALYQPESPGQVFMLDENSLVEGLEALQADPRWQGQFGFTESAGVATVYCKLAQGHDLLAHYYRQGAPA